MPYRSNSAASDVDLARFDLRIIRAMRSSGHPQPDGRARGIGLVRLAHTAQANAIAGAAGFPLVIVTRRRAQLARAEPVRWLCKRVGRSRRGDGTVANRTAA